MRFISLSVAILSLLVGCSDERPAGNLVINDTAGNVILIGNLQLPATFENGKSSGTWELLWAAPSFPIHSDKSGAYQSEMGNGVFSLDLNPGANDNNTILIVSDFLHDGVSGKWVHATIAGDQPMGTFKIAHTKIQLRDRWSLFIQLAGMAMVFLMGIVWGNSRYLICFAIVLGVVVNIVAQILIAGGGPGAFVGLAILPLIYVGVAMVGGAIGRVGRLMVRKKIG